MFKTRFISMLVLLAAVVTGAWAQEQSETIVTTDNNIVEGTHFTISNHDNYVDEDGMSADDEGITVTSKNGETITKVVITCTYDASYVRDGNTYVSSGTKEITNDGGTITVTGVNASVFTFECSYNTPQFGQFVVYYTEGPAASNYTVTLKEGTEDADNWTITPAEATTTGVAAGTTVTATYSGTKKVKSVKAKKKAAPAPALNLTSPAVGQVIGDDGKNYDYASLPGSVTAVAMIAKVSGTSGLAIALADEEGTMNWDTAVTTAAAHTPAFTGGTWRLPSQDEWKQMFSANGGSETSYSGLNTAIGNAGGTALQEYVAYWSSTENGSDNAYGMFLEDGNAYFGSDSKVLGNRVRACLAFTVESSAGPTYPLLSAATTEDYGKVVCAAGHLHDAKTAVPTDCTAVGILGKVTETGHGLILALANATSQTWNTINDWESVTTYAGTTLKVLPDDAARGSLTSYTTLGSTAVSNWAVAQKSDYEAIFTNLGSTMYSDGTTYDGNVNAFITEGVGGTAIAGYCWSATEVDGWPWFFYSNYWGDSSKTQDRNVRPVLGF